MAIASWQRLRVHIDIPHSFHHTRVMVVTKAPHVIIIPPKNSEINSTRNVIVMVCAVLGLYVPQKARNSTSRAADFRGVVTFRFGHEKIKLSTKSYASFHMETKMGTVGENVQITLGRSIDSAWLLFPPVGSQ